MYLFDRVFGSSPGLPPPPIQPFHGLELVYVFQHVDEVFQSITSQLGLPPLPPPPGDKLTEQTILHSWSGFAQGDINAAGGTAWPRYTQSAGSLLHLDELPHPDSGYDAAGCDLYDQMN
jgi:hypothetical protein